MALPALLRKLFKSSGYGPELNDGIVSRIISNQDWSNSYDYPIGVVVRGSDDGLYYSVAQSGPGTSAGAKNPAQGGNSGYWKSFGSGDSIPIGTVLWLSASTVPAGYLLCNGSAVGRAAYPDLFTAIGTTYGAGDGSTTFNLPNLIDKFAEGSATPGTVKTAGLPNIVGWFNLQNDAITDPVEGCFQKGAVHTRYTWGLNPGPEAPCGVVFSAELYSSIYGNSDTVQPPALTLLPCIKAFSSVVGDATVVAGQLANDIQSKVALDGSNASSISKTLSTYMANAAGIEYAHPVTVSLPYVAPEDGWMRFKGNASSINGSDCQIWYDYGSHSGCVYEIFWDGSSNTITTVAVVPITKGTRVFLYSGAVDIVEFYYANGSTIH